MAFLTRAAIPLLFRLCCYLLVFGAPGMVGAQTATTWSRWEQTLSSTASYANPYADVTVSVTYTGPGGQSFSTYGFWDDGNNWKIRCSFPAPGAWNWRTTCSNTGDSGLHNLTGQVTVAAYSGTNLLYAKGYLKVSSNNRYLTFNDGSPFFWVGDTVWSAPMNATQSEWQTYVLDRVAKKFTVLQIGPASIWAGTADRNGNTPFLGSGLSKWNPPYWQGLEAKVEYANQQGLVVLLVGVMEPVNRYPTSAEATLFARNIAARLYGNHVMFSPSFDSPNSQTTLADATGNALNAATTRHLITQHPGTDLPTIQAWHGKAFTDFTGIQTGAGWPEPLSADTVAYNAVNWVANIYGRAPVRPLINLEARYDNDFNQGQLPRLPRSCGYWSVLSGTAGYTYGCAGLMNWGATLNDPQNGTWNWQTGMSQPSSTHMKYFSEFFTARAWWTLMPASTLIMNQSSISIAKMVLAKSAAGDLAVAYLPDNPSIQINMGAFPSRMKATWFNCSAGTYFAGPSGITNSGTQTLNRPGSGDWALVLEPLLTGSSTGLVAGVVAAADPAGYSLTDRGTLDWAHWGRAGIADSFNHKVSGGDKISDVTAFISQDYPGTPVAYGALQAPGCSWSWTDGSPALAATNDDGCFYNAQQPGGGWSFTVPADTNTRTLYVCCGGSGSYASLKAQLSDGSAPSYSITNSGPGQYQNLHRIAYKAGVAGQRLTVTYLKIQEHGDPGGSVQLGAAWLTAGMPIVVQRIEVNGPNLELTVAWPNAGTAHQIEQSSSLTTPVWTTVSAVALADGPNGTLMASFPKPTGSPAFYRVITQ